MTEMGEKIAEMTQISKTKQEFPDIYPTSPI
jgi:hypothetical protein